MPDKDEQIAESITVFFTAVASTVLELDDITRQPDPALAFLEELKIQIDETKTSEFLPSQQRDFLRTLFSTFRSDVLSRQ